MILYLLTYPPTNSNIVVCVFIATGTCLLSHHLAIENSAIDSAYLRSCNEMNKGEGIYLSRASSPAYHCRS
jgi:hypothetical protein